MEKSFDIFNGGVRKAMKLADLSQEELCAGLGYSRKTLVENFSMAKMCEIEFLLGIPATELWNIDSPKEKIAYTRVKSEFEKRFCCAESIAWARHFPVRELQRLGCLNDSGMLPRELMKFLGVVSVDAWKVKYAVTQTAVNPHAYSAWLRLGEIQVRRPSNDFCVYREIIANNLRFLRNNSLSLKQNLRQIIVETLKKCDIAVLQVPAFIVAPTPWAAVYWKGARPVLQLATTPMSDSNFMETVYHAVGHILQQHNKRPCLLAPQSPLKDLDAVQGGLYAKRKMEESRRYCSEATRIAENLLLTEAEECEIICCGHFGEKRCIEYFSRKFHVRPGIIVSRLQRQCKIPARSPLNMYKVAV